MEIFAIFIALLVFIWMAEAIGDYLPERMKGKAFGVVNRIVPIILIGSFIWAIVWGGGDGGGAYLEPVYRR